MASWDGIDVDALSESLERKLKVVGDDEIKKKLYQTECPFTWELPFQEMNSVDMVRRTELKLEEMKNEDEGLESWKRFILNIVLCHQYTIKGRCNFPSPGAYEKLTESESSLREESSTTFFSSEGLYHILLAMRAFLLYYSQKYKEAEDLLEQLERPQNMPKTVLATINGARAGILMEYGYEGVKKSVSYVEEAIQLEPDCGEWHFLLGRALGRLRRVDARTNIPDKREIQALERACSLTPCKAFKTLLAQSYRETARSIFFNQKCDRETFKPYCNTLNQMSLELYRKLMEEAEENVHVNVRCAQGFLKLPKPYKNLPLAKKCLDKALSVSPENTFANHVAGTYYSMTYDVKRAIKHLKISAEAGNYGACMDLVNIQFTNQQNYDPVPDLIKMYERFKTVDSYREDTLCSLGAYFHFQCSDFWKALEYWLEVVDSNIHSEKLQVFRSQLVENSRPVNINKIIVNEILTQMNDGKLNKEQEELYNKLVAQYSEYHPGLIKVLSQQKNMRVPQKSAVSVSGKGKFSRNRLRSGKDEEKPEFTPEEVINHGGNGSNQKKTHK